MIELGELEGRLQVVKSLDLRSKLAVWEELPDLGSLTFKIELAKAYPTTGDA